MGAIQSFMEDDPLWNETRQQQEILALESLENLRIASSGNIEDTQVVRQPQTDSDLLFESACTSSRLSPQIKKINAVLSSDRSMHRSSANLKRTASAEECNTLTHMSETAGWVIPSGSDTKPIFTLAAEDQKEYTRSATEYRRALEAHDALSSAAGKNIQSSLPYQYLSGPKLKTDVNAIKYNSCSTLFVDGTLHSSDLVETLHGIALALACILRRNHYEGVELVTDDIFSEDLHPTMPDHLVSDECPNEETIFEFIYPLFWTMETNAECAVLALIYIERMLKYTGITLHALNWGRVILGGMLLATKVWTDDRIYNADFLGYLSDIGVKELNNLEVWYIKAITFNLSIKASTYAQYYFELRDLTERSYRHRSQKPLTVHEAVELETKTLYTEENVRQLRNKRKSISEEASKKSSSNSVAQSTDSTTLGLGIIDENPDNEPTMPPVQSPPQLRRARSDYIFAPFGSPAMVM